MDSRRSSFAPPPGLLRAAEWVVVLGLAGTLAWTTLCLGGYLAGTMVPVVVAVAFLSVLALGIACARETRSLHWAVLLPVPFLVYALASVYTLAPAQWLAWREWLLWLQMWLVFAVTLHCGRSPAQTTVLVVTFLGLGLVCVCLAAYQRFVDPTWMMLGRVQVPQFRGRSSGSFGISNSLAAFLELMVPVTLNLLLSRALRPAGKVFCGWLAALFVAAMVLTGSRGGWLALSGALLLWPLLATRRWSVKLTGAVVVLAIIAAGLWSLYRGSDYARERMRPFLEGQLELSRPQIWKAGVELWRESPWWGTGAGSYNVLFDRHRPARFLDNPEWAHNDYLNTLSDYGALGFGCWLAAGLALLALGWRAARYARRTATASDVLWLRGKWKLGLLLGLVGFALHLLVDFHTKIPALAFAAAISAALLLRDDPRLQRPVGRGACLAFTLLFIPSALAVVRLALPLYRAEALRFEARRLLDRPTSAGRDDLATRVTTARAQLGAAVRIDPQNAQAWSDLAYANTRGRHVLRLPPVALGRFAELAADRAIALCPVRAEFWVRRGVALDLQRGRPDAEACFKEAVALAPSNSVPQYYYAQYLWSLPGRLDDARRVSETCLALDPYSLAAESLRQQLALHR